MTPFPPLNPPPLSSAVAVQLAVYEGLVPRPFEWRQQTSASSVMAGMACPRTTVMTTVVGSQVEMAVHQAHMGCSFSWVQGHGLCGNIENLVAR